MWNSGAQICITDYSNKLTKDGFLYLCQPYGTVKNITIHCKRQDNFAFIEFEEENSVHRILNEKSVFPSCISIELSNQVLRELKTISNEENFLPLGNSEQIEKSSENDINKTGEVNTSGQSIYFGPNIYGEDLLTIMKQEKLEEKDKLFSLENDELFGKPMSKKWIAIKDLTFPIHSIDFHKRFENCNDGKIQIEKKLSPNMFTGWISIFNNGENVIESLKEISNAIEKSNVLNINDLELGMLIGAFDLITNLFARGYVTFVVGKSANVVLCDYGRAINATTFRTLPNVYSLLPIYSFKAYTKGEDSVAILKKSHKFNVKSVNADRIVLKLFIDDKKVKIQLKKWKPTVEEYGVPYVNIKSGSKVELIKFKDMNSVYIRSKEKSHFNLFFSTWNNLAAYCYENPKSLNREPFYGEIIAFKSKLDNNNYTRARIYKCLGNKFYIVKHMDNPFKEIVNSTEMIELQFKHKIAPLSVLKVGLKEAVPYPINGCAREFINHIFDHKLTVHFNEDDDGWKSIELYHSVIRENINNILLGLAQPMWLKPIQNNSMEEIGNYCKHSHLFKNELPVKSSVHLTFVLYHEGIFYMRDKHFGNSFLTMNNMIKEYCSLNLCPYLPHDNEVCLGQFPDGLWYRVICIQVKPGHLAKVYSVDLGNIAFLNTTNMKKIPEEVLYHPAHVYLCLLDNVDVISLEQNEILKQHENTDVDCTIVKYSNNKYLFKCPFLENILK
ncbi:uncharacterized protein LOC126906154 isoform X2 [Daktulosphaira vitifoliae]|uniref:uncharacterized protein LOC126906154 isoform X2 n=1 Tax=Daktulosphaira vitifoliae TaxID=58002 RepID=UPI0021AA3B07|nr:uncharacterized protein LOC126906154 isoform X2 [Daktulosphaira vitifoliae]